MFENFEWEFALLLFFTVYFSTDWHNDPERWISRNVIDDNSPSLTFDAYFDSPLSLFEDRTTNGRPIEKCHADHSILSVDGLPISSPDSVKLTAWKHRFGESRALILSKSQFKTIGSQYGVLRATFSDGPTTRRTPPTPLLVYLEWTEGDLSNDTVSLPVWFPLSLSHTTIHSAQDSHTWSIAGK